MLKYRIVWVFLGIAFGIILKNIWDYAQSPNVQSSAHEACARVLREQEESWNRGDIAGFLTHYDMNTEITFYSEDKVSEGWDKLNDRYRVRYSNPEAMGKLAFSDTYFTPISSTAVMVRGRWMLMDTPNAGSGLFTILIRKKDNGWKIVHDHTSAKAKN